jgi:hypothetical protein
MNSILELPDDPFLLHAVKSLSFIIDNPIFSDLEQSTARKYQQFFSINKDLEWEDLLTSKWEDLLFKILLISIPIYQKKCIRPIDNWEIVEMLSNLSSYNN